MLWKKHFERIVEKKRTPYDHESFCYQIVKAPSLKEEFWGMGFELVSFAGADNDFGQWSKQKAIKNTVIKSMKEDGWINPNSIIWNYGNTSS